jgi:hypothetical protein
MRESREAKWKPLHNCVKSMATVTVKDTSDVNTQL